MCLIFRNILGLGHFGADNGLARIASVCFWGYDLGKNIMYSATGTQKSDKLPLSSLVIAGGISALPATALMTPIERVKCLLQVQEGAGAKKYKGPVDVVRVLYKEGGIKSIYKGTGATLLRDIPGSMAYFGGYEFFKKILTPAGAKPEDLSPVAVLTAGGLAGIANWAVAIVSGIFSCAVRLSLILRPIAR